MGFHTGVGGSLGRPVFGLASLTKAAHGLLGRVRLYRRLLRDERVPGYLKGMVVMALLYVLSPFDVIPDFITPGLGLMDDLLLLMFVLQLMVRLCPRRVVLEHMAEMARGKGRS